MASIVLLMLTAYRPFLFFCASVNHRGPEGTIRWIQLPDILNPELSLNNDTICWIWGSRGGTQVGHVFTCQVFKCQGGDLEVKIIILLQRTLSRICRDDGRTIASGTHFLLNFQSLSEAEPVEIRHFQRLLFCKLCIKRARILVTDSLSNKLNSNIWPLTT